MISLSKKKLLLDFGQEVSLLRFADLPTVCEHSCCPNRYECSQQKVATFMIGGEFCTRNCAFCHVTHQKALPFGEIADKELRQLEEYLSRSRLRHVVITSVTRDDAEEELARHFADVTALIHAQGMSAELLIPDFHAREDCLRIILQAHPQVLSHNIETVRRLSPNIRPQASFERSLLLFDKVFSLCAFSCALPYPVLKSGFMLGLGENMQETRELFGELAAHKIDIVTVGQYMRPSEKELEVKRFYTDEEWRQIQEMSKDYAFAAFECGPYVRSSYKAYSLYCQAKENMKNLRFV